MEEPSITQILIEHKHHKPQRTPPLPALTLLGELQLFLRLLLTFERNYQAELMKADPEGVAKDALFVNRIPGYRKYQLIFLFYIRRMGVHLAFLIALILPLPLALLFVVGSWQLEWVKGMLGEQWEVVLVGIRCSALSYLCRYCLHFPSSSLNWIIYVGSIACGALTPNTTALLFVYALALCLSYFKSEDAASRDSLRQQQEQTKKDREELGKLKLPAVGKGRVYLVILGVFLVGCWIAQRTWLQAEGCQLVELLFMGLLGTSQELSSFFPPLSTHILPTANLYALAYLLPGLHLKVYFLLIGTHEWSFLILAYLALHLPSLLMLCFGVAERGVWVSGTWGKMRAGMQAVSNGLVLVGVGRMLGEQECHLHIVFFTTLVLLTVTKLYKLNELIAALLGVFLVASRAAVLHFNNKKPLAHFLCRK